MDRTKLVILFTVLTFIVGISLAQNQGGSSRGAKGSSGPSGPSGTSGSSGPSGPSGVSGSSGPTGPTAAIVTSINSSPLGSAICAKGADKSGIF
jgi:hypothetical protein